MKKSTLASAIVAGLVTLPSVQSVTAAGFIEDSKATLGLRTFGYDRNDLNTADNRSEAREWGQGLILNYQSGYTEGTVGFGLDAIALAGLRLDGGGDGDLGDRRKPGQLLPLDRDGEAVHSYAKAGLTGKLRVSASELRLGALQPKLPVVTFNDGRLLPQLFEGGQFSSTDIQNLTFTAGQLEHTKTRSSTDSIGLRIGGGAATADSNQFRYAGGDYRLTPALTLQYYYGELEDYYRQHFLGLLHSQPLAGGTLKTDLRFYDSGSDGANASATGRAAGYRSNGWWAAGDPQRGEVDNQTWSALLNYSHSGHAFDLGYQQVGDGSDFPFLNQGDGSTAYLITDRQIGKFQNAGERTWLAGYAYDFGQLGVPGLKASLVYLSGDQIEATGGDNREWERDLRLDYTVQAGSLKGLNLSWRNASLRGNDSTDQDENRLILSYSLPLL